MDSNNQSREHEESNAVENNKAKSHHTIPSFDIYTKESDPYIFITYSHKDAELVLSDLEKFNELGINIFYDGGIPLGSSWVKTVEEKIMNSKIFVPFLTPNTVESRFACDEILLAYISELPMLPIYLEETKLKNGLNLALGSKHSIFKYEMTEEEYEYIYTNEFTRHGLTNDEKSISQNNDPEEKMPKYFEQMGTSSQLFDSRPYKQLSVHDALSEATADALPTKSANMKSPLLINIFRKLFGKGNRKNSEINNHHRDYSSGDYIYVSYSHKDISLVIPEIERYKLEGYDVRFDKGLNYDTDLSETYKLIKNCGVFIVFLSKNSNNDLKIEYEVEYAFDTNKFIIPIFLDEFTLSDRLYFFLKNRQIIPKHYLSEEQYIQQIFSML